MLLKVNSIRNLHETITSNTIFSETFSNAKEVSPIMFTQVVVLKKNS